MSFIDPKLISNDQIKSAILSYLASVPDQARWQDYQSSSIGLTNIELLSGVGSFLAHRILLEGQESSLFSARNRASVIAKAEGLGYSVGRGTPAQVTVTMTNNTGGSFFLAEHSVIGKYNNLYDLVVTSPSAIGYSFANGESKAVTTYIGNLHWGPNEAVSGNGEPYSDGYSIGNPDTLYVRFMEQNVSDILDFYYAPNNTFGTTPIKVTNSFSELNNTLFAVISNYLGGIDVFSVNASGCTDPQYSRVSKIKYKYIEYANIDSIAIDSLGFYPQNNAVVTYSVNLTSNYFTASKPLESLDHIRVAAPYIHETSSLIRARKDERKVIQSIIPTALDANMRDSVTVSGGVDLTYLENVDASGGVLNTSPSASVAVMNALIAARPFGIPNPVLYPPKPLDVYLTVEYWPINLNIPSATIDTGIRNILKLYQYQFQKTIDLKEIENTIINTLPVKIARPYFTYDFEESVTIYPTITVDPTSGFNWIESSDVAASGNLVKNWPQGTEVQFYDFSWIHSGNITAGTGSVVNGSTAVSGANTYKIYWIPNTTSSSKRLYSVYDTDGISQLDFTCEGTGKMRGLIRNPTDWDEYSIIVPDSDLPSTLTTTPRLTLIPHY